ncbi:MAG TPA: hypothetical protein VMU21_11800 [Thermodesulfovibrionales bacterium]|nr:hypothetical protein [Thermodesulfovibrionales bacterium]
MYKTQGVICQYLKGSPEGAKCGVVNELIRALQDADIQLCMGRHYEVCSIYVSLLLRNAAETIKCNENVTIP